MKETTAGRKQRVVRAEQRQQRLAQLNPNYYKQQIEVCTGVLASARASGDSKAIRMLTGQIAYLKRQDGQQLTEAEQRLLNSDGNQRAEQRNSAQYGGADLRAVTK